MVQTYFKYNTWNNNRGNKDLGPLLILFFILPFAAFLYSLYNANKRSSYVIFLCLACYCAGIWHLQDTQITMTIFWEY